jgi:dCMP deaminase
MRPDLDQWAMEIAKVTASRATCVRRKVGCVLVNNKGYILATGYNGVPKGLNHCIANECSGSNASSGTRLDECLAVHAEMNALLQCNNVFDIHTVYVTVSPCIHCIKVLLNTSCKRIVFLEEYSDIRSKELWLSAGLEWSLL